MECDVIPDSPQEIDPLGNVENCNNLSDENTSYTIGPLTTTFIPSNDHIDGIAKNRKILNVTGVTTKNRKLLAIRTTTASSSSSSCSTSTASTVTKSNTISSGYVSLS